MSSRRRGGARGFTARTLIVATALALVAAVGFAVGGAGAAQQSFQPAKGLGAKGHDGIVDVSRYLGRNSRVPSGQRCRLLPCTCLSRPGTRAG